MAKGERTRVPLPFGFIAIRLIPQWWSQATGNQSTGGRLKNVTDEENRLAVGKGKYKTAGFTVMDNRSAGLDSAL